MVSENSILLAVFSTCLDPFSWMARMATLSSIHTLQTSHQ